MKIGLAWCVLFLSAQVVAVAEGVATPQALAERFVTAFNAGDTEAVRATCGEPLWNAKRDSPQKLIRQGYGAGRVWVLESRTVDVQEERAVIDVVVLRAADKRPADALFLYAERRDGAWLLYGLNEDKGFRRLFLAGVVPAGFDVNDLPSDAELEALGQRLLPIVAGLPEEPSWELFEQLTVSCFSVPAYARESIYLPVLASVRKPSAIKVWWSASLQRGAIEISEEETAENMFPEKVVLYLHRTATGWELYDAGTMLGTSALLGFPAAEEE